MYNIFCLQLVDPLSFFSLLIAGNDRRPTLDVIVHSDLSGYLEKWTNRLVKNQQAENAIYI